MSDLDDMIRASPMSLIENQEREEYLTYTKKVIKYNKEIAEYLNILDYDENPQQMNVLFDLLDPPKEDEHLVKMLVALRLSQ